MHRKDRRPLHFCKNCEEKINPEDHFCKNCGQENHDHHLTVKAMFLEFVESFTHFDNKIFTSYKTLIFNPGKLTKDYILGKRIQHVPPVRLYFFTAFVYFLLMGFMINKISEILNEFRNDDFNLVYNSSNMIRISKKGITKFQNVANQEDALKLLKQKLISKKDSLSKTKNSEKKIDSIKIINSFIAFCKMQALDSLKIVEFTKQKKDTLDVGGVKISSSEGTIKHQYNLSEFRNLQTQEKSKYVFALFKKPKFDTITDENDKIVITKDLVKKIYKNPKISDSVIETRNLNFFDKKKLKAKLYYATLSFYGTKSEKDRMIEDLGHKFTKYSSFAMYLMMPLSALFLWLFFYKKEKLYFPNFLLSMHLHTANFIFVMIAVSFIMLNVYFGGSYWISGVILLILLLVILYYFYKTLRYFYELSVKKIIFKEIIVAILYFALFILLIGGIGLMTAFN